MPGPRTIRIGIVAATALAMLGTGSTGLGHGPVATPTVEASGPAAQLTSPFAPVTPPTPTPTPTSYTVAAPADPAAVTVGDTSFFGWALLNLADGTVTGSANDASGTNTMESMVKPWIVGDYLRRLAEAGRTPSDADLREATLAIIDSNDQAAQDLYRRGGGDQVIARLISICGLTDTTTRSGWWSYTRMPPADAVRYGQCVADGRAAGPQWTGWLLDTMKQIRGGVADQVSTQVEGGRWGIIDGLPASLASQVSFKNGWTSYVDGWHVNCLGIGPGWVLAVMMRFNGGLPGAAAGCASVAQALVTTVPQ